MGRKRKTEGIPESRKEAEENPESEWESPTTQYILKLPCNLIMDIFSRLPLKTLINCWYVCKTWQKTLSDPNFAYPHLSRSPISVLLKTIHKNRESRMLHWVDLEGPGPFYRGARLKLAHKGKIPNVKVCLENSCNGLLCFSDEDARDSIYICNPLLGECITLPKAQEGMKCVSGVGFGFSHETNEYKVIRILYSNNDDDDDEKYVVEIYTLGGGGSWRSIGNVPYSLPYTSRFNTYVNGALHWDVCDYRSPDFIRSFHFGSEQFGMVPVPATFGPLKKQVVEYWSLGVLGGCLCICDFSDYNHIDVWVMKNYGVKESWTKDIVINYLIDEGKDIDIYEPIMTLENGEIMMVFKDKDLVLYSPETEVFDFVDMFGVKSKFHAIAHTPSFVSLRNVAKGESLKVQRNNRARKRRRMQVREATKEDDTGHGEQDQPPSSSITYLPRHILMDILSRLSVKTIFTCRCVNVGPRRRPTKVLFLVEEDRNMMTDSDSDF